jgi:hypothetical protein
MSKPLPREGPKAVAADFVRLYHSPSTGRALLPPSLYMTIRYYALWGAASLSLAYAQDFAPQTWFEDLPANDDSILRCYTLRTIPGVRYQVESSQNLVDWHQETELYGLGQDYTVPMHEVSPPGESSTVTSGNEATNVSIMVRPSVSNSGDLVISWPSVDTGTPTTFLLSNAGAIGWNQLPLFSWLQGTHQLFIRYDSSPVTPPAEIPTLGSQDSEMVTAFQAAIPSINEAIGNSTALARNTPLAGSAATEEKKFWRVRYDWTGDLDRDGTPDWAEFENLVNGGTDSVGNNAYNADSNSDGIEDGKQTDTDGDGTFDFGDIVLGDATASFAKYAQPSYALFPINNASPDPIYPSPLAINDKGTVLYGNGTWSGGVWTSLVGYSNSEAPVIRAALINDHGEILGSRAGSADNTFTPGNLVYWADPEADYQMVSVNGDYPWIGGIYGYADPTNSYLKFSNSGQIIGYQQWEHPEDHTSEPDKFLWTLPGNGRTPGKTPVPLYEGGVLDNTHYWGWEVGQAFSLFSDGTKLTPLKDVRELTVGPHGELIVHFQSDAETQVYVNGQWQTSKTYGKAIGVASDGTAIGRKDNGSEAPILLNGRWTSMKRYAPEAPPEWANSNTELQDISRGGWVLAKRPTGNSTATFGLLLPITVDGIDSSVTPPDMEDLGSGVDRTSMAAAGGDGYVPEIWVMAPIGGSNSVRFRAPVDPISPVKLTCDTATFSPATLQEKDCQLQVAGTGTNSQDSPAKLKLGDQLDSLSIPLRVKTMKRRTVKVALHRVHGLDANGMETVPRYFPTKEQLENYLNKVYGRQTNTFFDVTIYDDNGTGVDFDYNDDGYLVTDSIDFFAATPNPRAGVEGTHIDVWVTGGVYILYYDKGASLRRAYGITSGAMKIVIDGDLTNMKSPPDGEKAEHLLNTIAHEIGHVMTGGLGHPDDPGAEKTNIVGYGNNGADPNIENRLMVSGSISYGKKPTCLIKKEWDLIENWLKKLEEEGKL